MGLDDFSTDDNDSSSKSDDWEDDWDTPKVEEDDFPTPEQMGEILRHHVLDKGVDIEVDDGELTGDAGEFGKLFALMFLGYPDADPYSLEDPR